MDEFLMRSTEAGIEMRRINLWLVAIALAFLMILSASLIQINRDNTIKRQQHERVFTELLASAGYQADNYDFNPEKIEIDGDRIWVTLTLDGCVGYDVRAISSIKDPTNFRVVFPNGEALVDGSPSKDALEVGISTGDLCTSEGPKSLND